MGKTILKAIPSTQSENSTAPLKKLVAVVPAYNEEQNISFVIRELRQAHVVKCKIDFVVVDDGSIDKTSEVVRSMGGNVVSLPYNMGIGMTVQTGFRYALSRQADFVAQVDGDGQHIAQELSKLVPLVESGEADVVVGSRFIDGHREGIKSTTLLRWFAGRLLAWAVNFLVGEQLTDTTSGFRIFNRAAAEFISHHYPDDYPEVEVLVILARNGFKIKEVPVQMRGRRYGQSSINWSRSVYYIVKVLFASFLDVLRPGSRRR